MAPLRGRDGGTSYYGGSRGSGCSEWAEGQDSWEIELGSNTHHSEAVLRGQASPWASSWGGREVWGAASSDGSQHHVGGRRGKRGGGSTRGAADCLGGLPFRQATQADGNPWGKGGPQMMWASANRAEPSAGCHMAKLRPGETQSQTQPHQLHHRRVDARQPQPRMARHMPSLSAEQLVTASPEMQKNLLGERLLPAILEVLVGRDKSLGSRITGMLLEMDNSELLILLTCEEQLQIKVEEALQLLEAEVELYDEQPACGKGAGSGISGISQRSVVSVTQAEASYGVVGDLDGAEYVTHALTLPCALMAQATLEGRRLIESRTWRISHGWYALHASSRPLPSDWDEALQLCWPEAPPANALLGDIVGGLVYIEEPPLDSSEIGEDAWARGPVCHLVSKVISLKRPVSCSGSGGLWPLPPAVLEQVLQQLPDLAVKYFDVSRFLRSRGNDV
eukprot:TRINITY_DN60718_c0_g1_i1.p1 TRINITY_DN60718_c0_g1~~TRINITY_DN60718_c0_g1_i1.p1  ORF type:complete len:450 (+),score=68.46 TRINITY_DN60718_c0_g1_i1:127-1476(+)